MTIEADQIADPVKGARFKWWLPFFAALGALIIGLSILISGAFDLIGLIYVYLGVPFASLLFAGYVFVVGRRKKQWPGLPILLILPVYWAVTWVLFANDYDVRNAARWILEAKNYKAAVLRQPATSNDELRHVEWDGWGWAGMDTTVYLVYDPEDSLSEPAKMHNSGKFGGIPCAVPRVQKLESHWYSVRYYTDATWNECD
jgi:hypothetical protein